MELHEYASQDGLGLADLIRRKEVSVGEVRVCALASIEKQNPEINAVIEVFDAPEIAAEPDPCSPFFGVPFLVKDLILHIADRPYELGSRLAKGLVTPHDTDLMRAFRSAGLQTLGRCSTPEFGFCTTTECIVNGPTRNPWNPALMPGGSSGATAAAVAAGMVPMAHANDGGGSIRCPASCCGLVGLKPTRGRTPSGPDVAEGIFGLGIEFAVTRTVRDAASLLDAVQGPGLGDPYVIAAPVRPYAEEIQQAPRQLKIAFSVDAASGTHVEPWIQEAVRTQAESLEKLGHDVVEARPQYDHDAFFDSNLIYWITGLANFVDHVSALTGRPVNTDTLEATTLACYQEGKKFSADDLINALAVGNQTCRAIAPFFDNYDVLLSPTNALSPQPLGTYNANDPNLDARGWAEHIFSFAPFTAVYNLTGQPAISLPLSTHDKAPIGLQFVGRYGDEATLLRLAEQIYQHTPWPLLANSDNDTDDF